jgi:predicted transposase YbfD/YdcC
LTDIILLTISAVLSGASDWEEIELFGHSQLKWLKKHGRFTNGTPSHDTINRVISSIAPDQFNHCFVQWINEIFSPSKGEVIAIDGKRIRGSYDTNSGKSAIHMVSAFATDHGLCLGQVSTDEKSNEITAIPQLLDNLDIKGCTVTIDAMGCQTAIAKRIIDRGADYILAVKGNQGGLQQGIADTIRFNDPIEIDTNEDIGHGRIETRICRVFELSDHIENVDRWRNIKHIVEIESKRIIKSTGETSLEKRVYITSKKADAITFNKDIRNHWAIENKLHWVLDVTFGEDESRKRQKYAAENFNTISKIALTLLSNDTTLRKSKKKKRLAAALEASYREKLLNL